MNGPTAATNDQAPQPWWPCPECGGIHFHTTCVFERGEWTDENTYVHFDPPSGWPQGVNASEVSCVDCGHVFNIAEHYGWPIVGERGDATEGGPT